MNPPWPAPVLDSRSYEQLRDEALARIPIHNPEWTNFNRSDPGVTLIELFAFLADSVRYRANQIPERNRSAFLSLLGVPLAPSTSARGLVQLSIDSGPQRALTLGGGLELTAGQVSFRTEMALDLLPVEAVGYVKRPLAEPSQDLLDSYGALYASFTGGQPDPDSLQLYETVAVTPRDSAGVDLLQTADSSLWIALLLRRSDGAGDAALAGARAALAGKTLSLAVVPVVDDPHATLSPVGRSVGDARARLDYQLPSVAPSGRLDGPAGRIAHYRSLDARATANVLDEPGVVELTLPGEEGLALWQDVDPLEAGSGDLPPALEDSKLAARVVTWLRVRASGGARARLLWAGVNAVAVTQEARVAGEVLPAGSGKPDQSARLAHPPVLPETVVLRVDDTPWTRIDDLYTASPEVPVADLRLAPGVRTPQPRDPRVFTVDAATGTVSFGDGMHGARPPAGAAIRAEYSYGAGAAGNVEANAITSGSSLPAGVKVSNPLRTWGGSKAETVADGERNVPRRLRDGDRLVSRDDFEAIVRRTPGVDVGRVDVIPAYSPELGSSAPGDAPGAVTLLVIPRVDPRHPDAPQPDQPFLDAICSYIDPRRIVTTETFLRGPDYKPIWLSVGIEVVAGVSVASVRDAVRAALLEYLSPLPAPSATGPFAHAATGWPREKQVVPLELLAVASRVRGVNLVGRVLLAGGTGAASDGDPVAMTGLQLPWVAGLSVVAGDALALDELRGSAPPAAPVSRHVVPVPVTPDSC
jgi:hypothetical protein